MSLQHVPYAQQQSRLSLVPEAPIPRPDSINKRHSIIARRDTEKRRSELHEPPIQDGQLQLSNPLSVRTRSDTQLYAPIRRRSLLQHGVATRNSWVENDPRQSLPSQSQSQSDIQNYYYDPAKSTSSPLAELAIMVPRFPEYASDEPRARTPNDFDYGHIGAFKLGSLRITNGAASPVPSLETIGRQSGDHANSGDSQPPTRKTLGQRSHTVSVPAEKYKPVWITTSESPLAHEFVLPQTPKSLKVNTHLPLPEYSAFNFTNGHSTSRSVELAREYQESLVLSPFSFDESPPASPKLEATSKHTALEDDLFAAEPRTPELAEFQSPRSFDSGYQAEETLLARTKAARDLTPKPLAKADSGYSSNVSLRSFKKEERTPRPKTPVRAASSTYSVSSSIYSAASDTTIHPEQYVPEIIVQDVITAPPTRQAPPVPQKDTDVHRQSLPALQQTTPNRPLTLQPVSPANANSIQQNGRTNSSPNYIEASKERPAPRSSPSGSEASTTSSSSTSRWRLKSNSRSTSAFQLPEPQPIFTVSASRVTDTQLNHNIPPVSPEAAKRLEERVDAFPLNCFPNTFDSTPMLRKSTSKETLGTIFSVGSLEGKDELTTARLHSFLPAVPATVLERPRPAIESRRFTYQPQAPTASVQSRKPLPQRQSYQPVSQDHPALRRKMQQDFEAEITSYENIASGLGSSPYDAAITADKSKSAEQERAKTITAQFEADAAARFLQRRSMVPEMKSAVHRAMSYESIANQNPFNSPINSRVSSQEAAFQSAVSSRVPSRELPTTSQAPPPQAPMKNPTHTRVSSRELRASSRDGPPSAHQNPNSPRQRSFPMHQAPSDDRNSSSPSISKLKLPPPVPMSTQRRTSSQPPQQPAPPLPPARAAPTPPEEKPLDPWAVQRDYWTLRKAEALKTRKSMEATRPSNTFSPPLPSQLGVGILINRPGSAQPISELRNAQGVKKKVSFEGTPVSKHEEVRGARQVSGRSFRSWDTSAQRWDKYEGGGGYDHMYGSQSQMKGRGQARGEEEEEYYERAVENNFAGERALERGSTTEMMGLEAFTHALVHDPAMRSTSGGYGVSLPMGSPRMRVQS